MLLSIDIGNSNIVIGIYPLPTAGDGPVGAPVASWRLSTERQRTEDEYRLVLRQLLEEAGFQISLIQDAALSSVVAPLSEVWVQLLTHLLGKAPLVIRYGMTLGIEVAVARPEVIGRDRLVDAVAAYTRGQGAAIVVDFGTATTFNVINSAGIFSGRRHCTRAGNRHPRLGRSGQRPACRGTSGPAPRHRPRHHSRHPIGAGLRLCGAGGRAAWAHQT